MKKLTVMFITLLALTASGSARADLTPSFGYVAPGWVAVPGPAGPGPVDLSAVWHAFGHPESGVGYAYVSGPAGSSPYWEHFDPLGESYETFFGAYVVTSGFPFAADWENPDGTAKTHMTASDVTNSANELVALGDVDQFAWLSFYSAPYGGPTAATPTGAPIVTPAAEGFWRVTFFVNTTSDLGAPTQPAPWVPPYATYAADVAPFEPVLVEASALIKYDVPSGDFVAVYGSAANYQVDGHGENTPLGTVVEIGLMQAATTFH